MINTKTMNADAFSDERNAAQVKATLNGTQVITRENIISAKLQENLADKNITIGAAFSQSFEMKMRMPTQDILLKGAYMVPEASFNGSEWVRLGKFYVSSVRTSDNYKTVSITAVDRMALLTEQYTPRVNLPTTPQEVMEDIAVQYNIELDPDITYADLTINQFYEAKVRDYIGWIAGLSGKNARFNRDGKLTFTWYRQIIATYGDANMDNIVDTEDINYINSNLIGSASGEQYEAILGRLITGKAYMGAEIKDPVKALLADVDQNGIVNSDDTAEIQAHIDGTPYESTIVGVVKEYMQILDESRIERNGFILSAAESYTFSALISGTDDNPIETGAGKAINFYNPYMTQSLLNAIAEKILPFTYLAAEVTYRGNPAWEVGDIVGVESGEGYIIPIMSQTLEFGTKFSAVIKSYGASDEEESAMRTVPDIKEVQRQLPEIKQILSEINESLLSGDAGYMELIMETIDGIERLSGFRIMDTPTLSDSTKGWLANKNGIGWSQDGFKSISKLGLDMANGKIYADQIAAGAIITNSFSIGEAMSFNGDTGEIVFGSNVKMSWESIEDHPTNLSDLYNDKGFIDSAAATIITNNAISTASIRANQVQAGSFTITGGTINIDTDSETDSVIKLSYEIADYYGTRIAELCAGMLKISNDVNSSYISADTVSTYGVDTTTVRADYIYLGGTSIRNLFYESGDSPTFGDVYCSHVGSESDYPTLIYSNNVCVKSSTTTSNAYCGFNSLGYLQKYSGSSLRYKHGIKELSTELKSKFEGLYNLEVKSWTYNDDYIDESDELYQAETYGLIAEDVAAVLPEASVHDKDGNVDNYRDRQLLNAMLFLLQEQKKSIDDLEERIERLVN